MSDFPKEFLVETNTPEKDFLRVINSAERQNNDRKRFLHVDQNVFHPTSVNIGNYYFVAEGITEQPKSIFGLPLVTTRHKEPWEKRLNTNFNVADIKIPIPRVRFILDYTVQPPQIICRATL